MKKSIWLFILLFIGLAVNSNGLKKIDIPVFEGDLYIACTKDIADQEIEQWQSALDTIKSNGVYDSIYERYK